MLMDSATCRLIESFHRHGPKSVLAVTGGGAEAIGMLLSVPGGSHTILEAVVPYDSQALSEFLGKSLAQTCSPATAQSMAVRAYERAGWLALGEAVLGLGCTASLATDRPKRGDHRVHVAVQTATGLRAYSVTLLKGARNRQEEEAVLDAILLNALAEAAGITERLTPSLLDNEVIQNESAPADPLISLLRGDLAAVCVSIDGQVSANASRPDALLPGSFNPVHEGHWRLAELAAQRTGLAVGFELSVTNVDKPTLALA